MELIVQNGIETYIGFVTPWVLLVVMLIGVLYTHWTHKLDKKINDEVDKREKEDERVMQCIKEVNRETVQSFKEGIKEERQFRNDVMLKQAQHIEQIFEALRIISGDVKSLQTKLDSNIEHQEEICKIRHDDADGVKDHVFSILEKQEEICRKRHEA